MPSLLTTADETLVDDRDDSAAAGHATQTAVRKTTLVVDPCGDLGFGFAARSGAPAEDTLVVSDRSCDWPAGRVIACNSFVAPTTESGDPPRGAGLFDHPIAKMVLFLPPRPTSHLAAIIDRCVDIAARSERCLACLVSSVAVGSDDHEPAVLEESVGTRFRAANVKTVILRTGFLDADDQSRALLPGWSAWFPLVPPSLTNVFVTRDELFSAIDRVDTLNARMRHRHLTLLGSRRPLRDVLQEHCQPGLSTAWRVALAYLLSWLQIGRLPAVAIARFHPLFRRWGQTTLEPATVDQLLSLYHPLNQRHVALAGYNTGVTHFGWKYAGRTVIRTTGCGRLVRVGQDSVTVDAGVLLKRAVEELRTRGKEFYVLPNYSYISLGTTFMVPVHGSGCNVSTLSETIEQVVVYDPRADRIIRLRRGDESFGRFMYNPSSGVLVLRLRLRIRDRSRYFVKRSRLQSPSAADILATFADPDAANIELRKSRAGDPAVDVSRYFKTASDGQTLEVPRDSIGRLWDRLEENPVASWLFHTYVRRYGFHVELFLDKREFEVFWRLHAILPLAKIQLRLVRCDGLSHSPFGDGDRIAVDLFMQRRHSAAFLAFMKEHVPHARFNPGKHSM